MAPALRTISESVGGILTRWHHTPSRVWSTVRPQKILAQGTDRRFINELKKELEGHGCALQTTTPRAAASHSGAATPAPPPSATGTRVPAPPAPASESRTDLGTCHARAGTDHGCLPRRPCPGPSTHPAQRSRRGDSRWLRAQTECRPRDAAVLRYSRQGPRDRARTGHRHSSRPPGGLLGKGPPAASPSRRPRTGHTGLGIPDTCRPAAGRR